MHGKIEEHPNLDTLADFAEGLLANAEIELIGQHLKQCIPCSLETWRLARFATIDTDEDLLTEADWSRARFLLGKSYQEMIRPVITALPRQHEDRQQDDLQPADSQQEGRKQTVRRPAGQQPDDRMHSIRQRIFTSRAWLLAPIAAAAVLVLVFLNLDRGPGPESPSTWQETFRGEQQLVPVIAPDVPLGEVPACPQYFSWQTGEAFDTYTLEIFTPNLETVFKLDNITTTRFTVTESLQEQLVPGQTYLWSIRGHRGLRAASISANGWFRILNH